MLTFGNGILAAVIVALMSCFFSITHSQDTKEARMLKVTTSRFQCETEGFFPDPSDCSIFYRCLDYGESSENSVQSRYTLFKFQCTGGSVFSPETHSCVPASKSTRSECQNYDSEPLLINIPRADNNANNQLDYGVVRPQSIKPSPQQSSYNKPNSNPSLEPMNEIDNMIGEQPPRRTRSPPCNAEGFFPIENDCIHFYRCAPNGNGFIKYEFSCGEGTVWDPDNNACNHAWAVQRTDCQNVGSDGDDQSGMIPQGNNANPNQEEYPNQEGYPNQGGGYPDQNGGYPDQNGGYPDQNGGNPNGNETPEPEQNFNSSPGYPNPTTTTDIQSTTSDYGSIPPNGGSGNNSCTSEGFHPVPNNCSKFIRCVNFGNGFTKFEFDCAEGTVWDTDVETCNYPYAVRRSDCKSGQTGTTSSGYEPDSGTTSNLPTVTNDAQMSTTSDQQSGTTSQMASTSSSSFNQSSSSTSSQTSSTSSQQTSSTSSQSMSSSSQSGTTSSGQQTTGNTSGQQTSTTSSGQQTSSSGQQTSSSGQQTSSTSSGQQTSSSGQQTSSTSSGQQTSSSGQQTSSTSSGQQTTSTGQQGTSSTGGNQANMTTSSSTGNEDRCTEEGFFPSSKSCNKFYRCVSNERGGFTKYEFNCGPGTVFDPDYNVCNHPWAVRDEKCRTGGQDGPQGSTSPVSSSESTPTQSSSSSTMKPSSSVTTRPSQNNTTTRKPEATKPTKPSNQTSKPPGSTTKRPQTSATTKKPTSNLTTQSSGTKPGSSSTTKKPTTKPGSSSTTQKPTTKPGSSSTTKKPTTKPGTNSTTQKPGTKPGSSSTTQSPKPTNETQPNNNNSTTEAPCQNSTKPASKITCTKAGFYPHPDDCKKFYRCVDWDGDKGERFSVYYFDCPEGTIFDPSLSTCNHAESVYPPRDCSNSGNATTTSTTTPNNNSTDSEETSTPGDNTSTPTVTDNTTTNSTEAYTEQPITSSSETTNYPTSTPSQTDITTNPTGETTPPTTNGMTTDSAGTTNAGSTMQSTMNPTEITTNPTNPTNPTNQMTTTTNPTTTDITTMPTTQMNERCPEMEPDQFAIVCPTGFRRHPKYCNLFYQCTTSPTNEIKVLTLSCANGTVYDDKKIQCLPPDEAKKCDGSMMDTRSVRQMAENSIAPIPVRSDKTICPNEGSFVYKDDCRLFYKCKKNDEGRLSGFIYQCPDGFGYWNISKRCEKIEKINCNIGNKKLISRPTLAPVESKNLGHKK